MQATSCHTAPACRITSRAAAVPGKRGKRRFSCAGGRARLMRLKLGGGPFRPEPQAASGLLLRLSLSW